MEYLIYDEDGDFVDSLDFKSTSEKDAYIAKNPNHCIKKITDVESLDIDVLDDDDDYVMNNGW